MDIKLFLIPVLVMIIIGSFSVNYALGASTIKQVIKIQGAIPAGSASNDYKIDPPLTDTSKTFVFVSFSHTGEEDHANTFNSYEIINPTTLRVYGDNTAAGNIAKDFEAYIIEYTGTIDVQHSSRVTVASEAEGEKSVTISAVTPAETMVVSKGHDHDGADTSIASEELDRIRLLTSTTWGWFVFDTPNSGPQNNLVDVIDWNDPSIVVQRGIVTLADTSTTTTVTPPSAVDRTRTMLLVTYACGTGCTTSEEPNDFMLRATLNPSNNIVITRNAGEDAMQIAWTTIQFPATMVKTTYDTITLAGGTLSATDILASSVADFDKTIVFSPVGTPFGWSTGSTDTVTTGAIDRAMTDIHLDDNNLVEVRRGDSTGTMILEYEVVEFLEPQLAQNPQGTDVFSKIVTVEGDFTLADTVQDYTISPALTDVSKTIMLFSLNSSNPGELGSAQYTKSFDILNPTTLRVTAGGGAGVNRPAHFVVYLAEFTGPIFTQMDQLQYPQTLADTTLTNTISAVNTTGAFICTMGTTMSEQAIFSPDPTFGSEEFARITLTGSTTWLHEVDDIQDEAETTRRVEVVDWNDDDIFVQHGTGTMAGTTTSVTPPIAIDREDTILMVNFMTTSNAVGEDPADTAIRATLDGSNNVVITRNSAGSSIAYSWETITFPENFISVQHGEQTQGVGVEVNTATITPVDLSKSLVAGTVHSFFNQALGSGSSTTVNDFAAVSGLVKLTDSSTITFTRGHDAGTWTVGYQVIQFAPAVVGANDDIQTQPSCCFFFTLPLPQWIVDLILPVIYIQIYLFSALIFGRLI